MIYLITGTPGAGKTLRAVSMAADFFAKDRKVFTNIDGFDPPGFHRVDELEDADWRNAEEGSVIIYDEAQHRYPGKARAVNKIEVDPEELTAMELHRHRGIDIVLCTQKANLVHAGVLGLVGRHEHFTRVFGLGRVKAYWSDEVMLTKADLKESNKMPWKHPKRWMDAYKSASTHNKDIRVPISVKLGLGFVLVYFVWLAIKISGGFFDYREVKNAQTVDLLQPAVAAQPAAAQAPVQPVRLPQASGCVRASGFCACYGIDHKRLNLDVEQCIQVAEQRIVTADSLQQAREGVVTLAANQGLGAVSEKAKAMAGR